MTADTDGFRLGRHERRLRLLVLHLSSRSLRARADPDDIVQEIYVRAWSAPSGLPADDGEGDLELWRFLAHIARNTVIDIARAARAQKRGGTVERLARSDWTRSSDPRAETAGPLTRAMAAETQGELEAAFDRLDPEHRRVIGLRQFEGLSAADTAERMGRSESAVHSLYRRALAAWTEAFGG